MTRMMRQPGSTKKILRAVAAAAIVLAGILVFMFASHPADKDYISYWSSAKQLIHHADPYSPHQVLALEKSQGYSETRPIMMRNPPWALFLIAPLGFGSALTGLLLWTLAAVGCILLSAYLLDIPRKDRAFAFAFVFAPALACICAGQSSLILLLGFSLFLRFHRSHPFLAGASLLLMAIKPHLFLVFWVILLIDCVYQRRFRILAGGASALTVASAFAMCFDPRIWPHYFAMLHWSSLNQEFFPTASTLFRMLINVRAVWLLFVPSTGAILWGIWYYAARREEWDWRAHGMLLMVITVFASPYGWLTDEAVLLPCILFAFTTPEKRKYSASILLAINTAILVIVGTQAQLSSRAYVWTPFAWLAWFLYATGKKHFSSRIEKAGMREETFIVN